VTLFETAESYGDGESERLLGEILSRSQARGSIVLATRLSPEEWTPIRTCTPPPWSTPAGAVLRAKAFSTTRAGYRAVAPLQQPAPG
jgi:aryl-alcohol dehydrogenase-like predicted oxidoreductase